MKKYIFLFLLLCNLAFAQTDLVLTFSGTNRPVEYLYNDCFNGISINAPNIPDSSYFPIATIGKGTIKQSPTNKHNFLIVPTGSKTILTVSNQLPNGETQILAQISLKVLLPASPSLVWKVNNRLYMPNTKVKKGSIVQIEIQPDIDFMKNLPNEAHYSISSIVIFMSSSDKPPHKVSERLYEEKKASKLYTVLLPDECFLIPESKIYVEFTTLQRINLKRETIKINYISAYDRQIMLLSK